MSTTESPSSSPTSSVSPSPRDARTIYEQADVEVLQPAKYSGLDKAVFQDKRWDNGIQYLRSNGMLDTPAQVRALLLEGARTFGIWHVSEAAMQGLVWQLTSLGGADSQASSPPISPGLQMWMTESQTAHDMCELSVSSESSGPDEVSRNINYLRGGNSPRVIRGSRSCCGARARARACARCCYQYAKHRRDDVQEWASFVAETSLGWIKAVMAILLIVVSCIYGSYVVWYKYAGILEEFMWPIFFARAGGLAAAMITGLMYLSMARSFMKPFYYCLRPGNFLLAAADGHKDMHIFYAECMTVAAIMHTASHLLATVPAISMRRTEDVNKLLGCANWEQAFGRWPRLTWFQWPDCPFDRTFHDWQIVFQSTPGVTGVALLLLWSIIAYTARARGRTHEFDVFWYVHNIAIWLWPAVMFIHGSNQWIGVGFPLVTFTAFIPFLLYMVDRFLRTVRYYAFSGTRVRIVDSMTRPGKRGGPDGALTYLSISRPPWLWSYMPGMYAFICMPEYAPLQWHPFTICSGKDDENVEFIIAGVGDWTQELNRKCLAVSSGERGEDYPRVALDGPYAAPTLSALSHEVLVAVGAGVGITPFLSLLSTIISTFEDESAREPPLKEAHFYWMTRSVDEFLFGQVHFTRIASSPRLRQKVHLHLHSTAREAEGSAASYFFRQALRRQCLVDRPKFREAFDEESFFPGLELPWTWVNNSKLDVMWLSDIARSENEAEALEEIAEMAQPGELVLSSMNFVGMTSHWSNASRRSPQRRMEQMARVQSEPARSSRPRQGTGYSSLSGCEPLGQTRTSPLPWQRQMLSGNGTASNRSADGAPEDVLVPEPVKEMLVPVTFGRPDFETELRAIGRHWQHAYDVSVYICGNDAIVKSLEETCKVLEAEAAERAEPQRYTVTYERFG